MFASAKEWEDQLEEVRQLGQQLAGQRGHAAKTPQELLHTIQLYEQLNSKAAQIGRDNELRSLQREVQKLKAEIAEPEHAQRSKDTAFEYSMRRPARARYRRTMARATNSIAPIGAAATRRRRPGSLSTSKAKTAARAKSIPSAAQP